MTVRGIVRRTSACVVVVVCAATGCDRDPSGLAPAPLSTDPVVFSDQLGEGVAFQPFLNVPSSRVSVVTDEKYLGSASLKVVVPAASDPSGWLVGGTFTSRDHRDLSGYEALTFYARASKGGVTLNTAGFGNDNTGTSQFEASRAGVALTTTWQRYVVPIPLPEKLSAERGLFFFAEGNEDDAGYEFWLDEIAFAKVGTIANPRPAIETKTVGVFAGATVSPGEARTTFAVGGADQLITHTPGYFSFASSDEEVAVITNGLIHVVGAGDAAITARLGEVEASGTITVRGNAVPVTPAPAPDLPPGEVISLFSNAYANVPVDTWWAEWSHNFSNLMDVKVAGDDVKAYTDLILAGIEFATHTIDATAMTHLHIDVWVPGDTEVFRVKLVDFGEDGAYGGAPDSERELSFSPVSVPPLLTETWVALDLPLSGFMGAGGLAQRAHLGRMVVSGAGNNAFIDNVYFHR